MLPVRDAYVWIVVIQKQRSKALELCGMLLLAILVI